MKKFMIFIIVCLMATATFAQKPIRVGTTAGEFLSVGYGPAGCSMGDAYVAVVDDITGIYWNPAGLAFMEQGQVMFSYQPWIADINTFFAGAGLVIPNMGTIALGVIGVDYGEMDVTTIEDQNGTGEKFTVKDYAFTLTYSRKLAQWFGFGASAKYVSSGIWHETASAFAFDLGVIINTPFFAPGGNQEKGLNIGMSLSNYGSPMKYKGLDLLRSYDIIEEEAGNYQDTKVTYQTDSWELPLIFRIGVALTPFSVRNHELVLAMDALHTNNNNESVNVGAQYMLNVPGLGKFFLRGGYRALFLEDSQFGPTFGAGISKQYMANKSVMIDFGYRDVGILGVAPTFSANFMF